MDYKRKGSNSLPNKAAFPTHMCYKGRPHLSLGFLVPCCVNVVYTVAIFYKKNEMLLWVCVFVSVATGKRACGGSRVEVRRHWHFLGILWSVPCNHHQMWKWCMHPLHSQYEKGIIEP